MNDAKKLINLLTFLLGLGLLAFVLLKLTGILTPFLAAFFLAYLFNPLVNKLSLLTIKNRRLPRTVGVILVFLVLITIAVVVTLVLMPVLINQLSFFIKNMFYWLGILQNEGLPWLVQKLNIKLDNFYFDFNLNNKDKSLLLEHGKQISSTLSSSMKSISNIVLQSGMTIIHLFLQISITVVVLFYVLRDWSSLFLTFKKIALTTPYGQVLIKITQNADAILTVFLRGQLLVMAALGLIYAFGLTLVGVHYGILLGFMSGLLSIVPYFGGAVGLFISLLVGYLQFHEWHSLALIIGVFGVGQLLESMVLTPKLVGDKLGLHPIWVIFALMAGGELFGFFGVLLALPIAAILVVLVKNFDEIRRSNDVGPTAF